MVAIEQPQHEIGMVVVVVVVVPATLSGDAGDDGSLMIDHTSYRGSLSSRSHMCTHTHWRTLEILLSLSLYLNGMRFEEEREEEREQQQQQEESVSLIEREEGDDDDDATAIDVSERHSTLRATAYHAQTIHHSHTHTTGLP